MNIKTITSTDGVNEVDFGSNASRFYWFQNLGTTTVHVSGNADIVAGADGVAELAAGGSVCIETLGGKVYVLGAGKVEIHNTGDKFPPFCNAPAAGGGEADAYTKSESDAKYAQKTDIPSSLPANGGTADTARQVTSPSSKIKIYEDNEGGNLRLVSPDGNHYMEMDLFDNESFRMYFDGGDGLVYPLCYNFTTKKISINGDADTVDGLHANDFPLKGNQIQFVPYNMKYYALEDKICLFSNDNDITRGIYFINNSSSSVTVCALISASAEGPVMQYGYGSNTYPEIQDTGEGREWFSEESIPTSPTIFAMTVPSGKLGYYGIYRNSESAYTTIHDIRCPYFNFF